MPVKCVWGDNAVAENSALFAELGKKCLIVTGKSGAKLSGALGDAVSALDSQGISYTLFDGISENPLVSSCFSAGCAARECKAEFVLGIGGGSVLDACKAIAIYASNPGLAPMDIYLREYSSKPLPVALIGTTAGTGSEVTSVAVLTNDETGRKKSISGADCYTQSRSATRNTPAPCPENQPYQPLLTLLLMRLRAFLRPSATGLSDFMRKNVFLSFTAV